MALLKENIRYLRESIDANQAEFAAKLGLNRPQLSSYEEGRAAPKVETLLQIAKIFSISVEILVEMDLQKMENEGLLEVIVSAEDVPSVKFSSEIAPNIAPNLPLSIKNAGNQPVNQMIQQVIPLVALDAFAGTGNSVFRIEEKDIKGMYVIPDFTKVDFMIRVKGNSMYPKYNSGDVVACRVLKERKFIQWNKVHILATKEQGILIKRLKKGTDTYVTAVSDNKEYEPFDIPWDDMDGIAIVVGVIRLE